MTAWNSFTLRDRLHAFCVSSRRLLGRTDWKFRRRPVSKPALESEGNHSLINPAGERIAPFSLAGCGQPVVPGTIRVLGHCPGRHPAQTALAQRKDVPPCGILREPGFPFRARASRDDKPMRRSDGAPSPRLGLP